MRGLLIKALAVLKVLATLTATKLDDEIVALLEMIAAEPEIIRWIETLVQAEEAGAMMAASDEPPQAIAAAIERRKIDWAKLLQHLPAIIAIFKTLM